MHHVQSHQLCKLARSQNSSYKLTDDMIYCWLRPISLSLVAWRGSQSWVSKGFQCLQSRAGEMEARSHYRLKFVHY